MLRRLAAGMVVAFALAGAAFATGSALVPSPAIARSVCTGWTSETIPPDTIRVLRTVGSDAGRVQDVTFRSYVETVMAAEFGPGAPPEAMEAGAVAVKQFAWYYAIHWRGGSNSAGDCYDVVDNGNDQWYMPRSKVPAMSHIDAVARTWTWSMRRAFKFFSPGYWAGGDVPCGANANGLRLMQKSAARCAREGKSAEEILRIYYGENILIVRPGTNDLNGDSLGDVPAFVTGTDGSVTARLYDGKTLGAAREGAESSGDAWPITLDPTTPNLHGTGDVDGDGRADLVYTRTTPSGATEVAVARVMDGGMYSAADSSGDASAASSSGDGFHAAAAKTVIEPPRSWWASSRSAAGTAPGTTPIAMAVADFTDDGKADVALATVLSSGDLAIDVLVSDGSSFLAPKRWWSGPVPGTLEALRAGDFDGDGRADLAMLTSDPAEGATASAERAVHVDVLRGDGDRHFSDPRPWLDEPIAADTATWFLAGDWNRDGRADLMTVRSNGPTGMLATAYVSDGERFEARVLRETTSGFRVSAAKLAVSDVNGDGRSDIVAFYDGGEAGTRILPMLSMGTRLSSLPATLDPGLDWSTIHPF